MSNMKKYEFQGKTVEKAIDQGLSELGLSQFDVDIKIIDSGSLFKKARVEIIVNDEEDSLVDIIKEETKEVVKEKNIEETVEESIKIAEENDIPVNQVVEEVKEIIKEVEKEILPKEEKNVQKKERVYANNKGSKEFLEGLLNKLNIEGTVEIIEEDEHAKAIISTEKAGLIIGHKGESLSAIQYLANIVEQKQNRYAKRVIIDVANYRENRDDSLKDLADRMARKVLKYHKAVKLNPMNAYDRRIVHTYLQGFKGVTTHSVGVEPHRCLIINLDRN